MVRSIKRRSGALDTLFDLDVINRRSVREGFDLTVDLTMSAHMYANVSDFYVFKIIFATKNQKLPMTVDVAWLQSLSCIT